MFSETWRLVVTDADVRAAKVVWLAARDGGSSAERVEMLFGDLQRVIHAQAQQMAEDFRAERALGPAIADLPGEA